VTSEDAADRPQIGGRLRRVLDFLVTFTDTHGYPPSMAQIGAGVGLTSTSSVAHHLGVLEGRGYIAREPHVPRAITILADLRVPKRTEHAAGDPDAPWADLTRALNSRWGTDPAHALCAMAAWEAGWRHVAQEAR
jgi:SOS-response transcriptional repressor LexA